MKINKKVIQLMQEGFSLETLQKMSDQNVNVLHKKLIGEQTKPSIVNIPKNDLAAIRDAQSKRKVFATYENKKKDGEMIEAKKSGKNPWAICTAQLKKEFGTSKRSEWSKAQKSKYEKCVKGIKSDIKENDNLVDQFIEDELLKMVESYIQPKITKKDLIKQLSEQPTTTKPTIKPSTPKIKPSREDNPFQNPRPGVKTPPKADTTTKPATKPATPKTKPTREDNPFQNPRPGVKTPPKAISSEKAKGAIINNIMQLINFKG